ncbi:hypothetical protein HMPREF3104_06365 [Corynebacterium sp. HMSC30G07]|nr:hypothetical protein HMPREF3104_06365 [Corynebacterium sp. HMSC30G07]
MWITLGKLSTVWLQTVVPPTTACHTAGMNFLSLTEQTARTALGHLPERVPIPTSTLDSSLTATALSQLQAKELLLHDATFHPLTAHLKSIATFARSVVDADDAWADQLAGKLRRFGRD